MRASSRGGPDIIVGLELKRLLRLIFISFGVLNINVDIKEREEEARALRHSVRIGTGVDTLY